MKKTVLGFFASFIFVSYLHAAPAVPADPDQDQDGVSDYEDHCPHTPAGKDVWKAADVNAGKIESKWVGCAAGELADPNYTLPQRPTLFSRVFDLYTQGTLPSFKVFEFADPLHGRKIFTSDRERVFPNGLVANQIGDEILGPLPLAQVVDGDADKASLCLKGITSEGYTCLRTPTPLAEDSNEKSLFYREVTPDGECDVAVHFREAVIASGKHILVYKRLNDDSRGVCNPAASGVYKGGIFEVGYFELP